MAINLSDIQDEIQMKYPKKFSIWPRFSVGGKRERINLEVRPALVLGKGYVAREVIAHYDREVEPVLVKANLLSSIGSSLLGWGSYEKTDETVEGQFYRAAIRRTDGKNGEVQI